MKREFNPKGVNTPWGIADWGYNYGEGIDCFSTPGHGGFRLSAVRRLQMPKGLREFVGYGGPGWYEEDCDWAVVALAFPSVFEAHDVWAAVRTVRGFSDGYGAGVKEWLDTQGASVLSIAARFEDENGAKFIQGSGGTMAGGDWSMDATSVDGTDRATFCFERYPSLPGLFTRDDVTAAGGVEQLKAVHIPDEMPA